MLCLPVRPFSLFFCGHCPCCGRAVEKKAEKGRFCGWKDTRRCNSARGRNGSAQNHRLDGALCVTRLSNDQQHRRPGSSRESSVLLIKFLSTLGMVIAKSTPRWGLLYSADVRISAAQTVEAGCEDDLCRVVLGLRVPLGYGSLFLSRGSRRLEREEKLFECACGQHGFVVLLPGLSSSSRACRDTAQWTGCTLTLLRYTAQRLGLVVERRATKSTTTTKKKASPPLHLAMP